MYTSLPSMTDTTNDMVNSGAEGLDNDKMLERYNELSQQSEALRHRLNISLPGWDSYSPGSESDEEADRSSSSPRRRDSSSMQSLIRSPTSSNASPVSRRRLSTSAPLGLVNSLPVGGSAEAYADEDNLHEVIQQMKAELTDLLNRDAVKHDQPFRHWVQARLMDAEMDLKHYRRRRSSNSVNEKILRAFAENLASAHPAVDERTSRL